jgi:hypothetical protein
MSQSINSTKIGDPNNSKTAFTSTINNNNNSNYSLSNIKNTNKNTETNTCVLIGFGTGSGGGESLSSISSASSAALSLLELKSSSSSPPPSNLLSQSQSQSLSLPLSSLSQTQTQTQTRTQSQSQTHQQAQAQDIEIEREEESNEYPFSPPYSPSSNYSNSNSVLPPLNLITKNHEAPNIVNLNANNPNRTVIMQNPPPPSSSTTTAHANSSSNSSSNIPSLSNAHNSQNFTNHHYNHNNQMSSQTLLPLSMHHTQNYSQPPSISHIHASYPQPHQNIQHLQHTSTLMHLQEQQQYVQHKNIIMSEPSSLSINSNSPSTTNSSTLSEAAVPTLKPSKPKSKTAASKSQPSIKTGATTATTPLSLSATSLSSSISTTATTPSTNTNSTPTTTSAEKPKAKPAISKEERDALRKVSHSAIERRRRERINDKILHLKSLIPALSAPVPTQPNRPALAGGGPSGGPANGGANNVHKLHILQSAIDYILELRERLGAAERTHGVRGTSNSVGAASSSGIVNGDVRMDVDVGLQETGWAGMDGRSRRSEEAAGAEQRGVDEAGRYETKMNLKNLLS